MNSVREFKQNFSKTHGRRFVVFDENDKMYCSGQTVWANALAAADECNGVVWQNGKPIAKAENARW